MAQNAQNSKRDDFSKEMFQEYGLVLSENESFKEYFERKNKIQERANQSFSFEEIRGALLENTNKKLAIVREDTANFTENIYDATAHYNFKLKNNLGIENLCSPLRAIYATSNTNLGLTLNPISTKPPIVVIASKNQFPLSINETIENYFLEHVDNFEIPQLDNLHSQVPQRNDPHHLASNKESNLSRASLNVILNHIEHTELHEGIHAIYLTNNPYTPTTENLIILECAAHKVSLDIQMDLALNNLNNKHNLYTAEKLSQIKQGFRILSTDEIKQTIKQEYGPHTKKEAKSQSSVLQLLGEIIDFNEKVNTYSNALHNCIESYVNNNKTIILAMHDSISLSFNDFIEKYNDK